MPRRKTKASGIPILLITDPNSETIRMEFRKDQSDKNDAAIIEISWWQAKLLINGFKELGKRASERCKCKGKAILKMSKGL